MNGSRRIAVFALGSLLLLFVASSSHAQQQYQRPPKAIADVLDAPAPPIPIVSPAGDALLLATPVRYRPISDLAEPFFRGGGLRVNPRNNASYLFNYYTALALQKTSDAAPRTIALPPNARVMEPRWNATGTLFTFANVTATTVELWVGDLDSATAHRVDGIRLNPVLGFAINWMPDQKTLLVKTVPANRGEVPAEVLTPSGPRVEDSKGVKAASSTYEAAELMRGPRDMDLFDYYAPSQFALVDAKSGAVTPIGEPALAWTLTPSPSGEYLLVERLHRPYSLLRAANRFPVEVEVWDLRGRKVETIASEPLAEDVPIGGVRVGPRDYAWRATAPATLVWVEALDEGDTYKKVPFHDRVVLKPVGGTTTELMRTEQRCERVAWIENTSLAYVSESDEEKHWIQSWLVDAADPKAAPRLVENVGADDVYHNPGDPVFRRLPNGAVAIRNAGGAIFRTGQGSSPTGDRPFLDRLDLHTLKSERLFRSAAEEYETFVAFADPARMTFFTKRESKTEPPNVVLRSVGGTVAQAVEGEARYASTARQLTHFADPAPQLRQISKRLVTYQRPDGVKLSFTLYLPPGYQAGTRLPTIIWAYPLDYTDPSSAGQVASAPQRFTTIFGASPVLLALAGYAVLDETSMPVVGPTATAYDTFVEQIVANAKAAIDKAVELGVTDRDRVGVMGHSHGALMTANLLVWSDLFRAGVARSGAYNHTLRPFGFQNERRTLYQAPETYLKLSPLFHADKINEPLLIIHGANDNNPGTVPLQSEKLFEAIRGAGGTSRLVMLPFEIHGYLARESVEHVLYETVSWFDQYVKNAPPRTATASANGAP